MLIQRDKAEIIFDILHKNNLLKIGYTHVCLYIYRYEL